MIKNLQEVRNLKDRRVLVRVDWNVPVGDDGRVDESEAFRVTKSLETIKYLRDSGAKTIVMSHIGRGKKDSLYPVAEYTKNLLPIRFIATWDHEAILGAVSNMSGGDVILLENLRQNTGEEENSEKFASFLSTLGDMYVNEAFAVSHRAHASLSAITQYLPSYAGLWLQKEISNLQKVMQEPERPFLFILGGAKFDTKISLIRKFEGVADEIFIGGALANNFFKRLGMEIGKSLVDDSEDTTEFFHKDHVSIPFDVIVKPENKSIELPLIQKTDTIVDIGAETLVELKKKISNAKTILWNGPLGLYEEGFDGSSKSILEAIGESGAFSVIGGGDTVKLVMELGLEDKLSFVSTGGGAMLEFLGAGTLPGIQALDQDGQISTDE